MIFSIYYNNFINYKTTTTILIDNLIILTITHTINKYLNKLFIISLPQIIDLE